MGVIINSILLVAISVIITTVINLLLLRKISDIATKEIKITEESVLNFIDPQK